MTLLIYPDVIFVINYIMNHLLLMVLARVCKRKLKFPRLAIASAFGALMACLMAVFYQIPFALRFFVMYILVAIVMVRIAFGRSNCKELARHVILLYAITYLVGGGCNSLFYNTRIGLTAWKFLSGSYLTHPNVKFLLLSLGLLFPVLQIIYFTIRKIFLYQQEIYDVKLVKGENELCVKALLDTGNELYDPLYQKPVVLLELEKAKEFLSLEEYDELCHSIHNLNENNSKEWMYQTSPKLTGLHTISYTSVGKPKGELVAFLLDQLFIQEEKNIIQKDKVIIAIYDKKFSMSNEYQMILHKNMIA